MGNNILSPFDIAFIATYPPRLCGIGTFTDDLRKGLNTIYEEAGNKQYRENPMVIALNNNAEGYNYGPEVSFVIRDQYKGDYLNTADFINLSPLKVVSLQHEYNIFGGEEGEYILTLLNRLKKPVVTTLHTVLKEPLPKQREVLRGICSLSTRVVVIAQKGMELLTSVYGVPREKIFMVHHGTPDVPFLDSSYYKEQFHAEGRKIILTFGLLHSNKGIENVIEALKWVVNKFPEVLYIVLGATHPIIKRQSGEQYRLTLERMVRDEELKDNVVFHNHFVTLEQLIQFLVACDIYVTPYIYQDQVSSGTLAYALACGKAIISTPYWYAQELLSDGRGILVPFQNSQALAEKLNLLLENEPLRNRLRKKAYQYGRQMVWREVANNYLSVFQHTLGEYGKVSSSRLLTTKLHEHPALPEINTLHLENLTDDTGLFRHAVFSTPDRLHGYCTDDNARALVVTVMNWRLFRSWNIMPLLQVYLGFLNHALAEANRLAKNAISFDRRWVEEPPLEDGHGRFIWALGYTIAHSPDDQVLGLSSKLFRQAVSPAFSVSLPLAQAYIILGCHSYLERFGGDTEVHLLEEKMSSSLLEKFSAVSPDSSWPWSEETVGEDSARLCQALILSGQKKQEEKMLETGLKVLKWLISIQTSASGHLSLIGNKGWFQKGKEKAQFDQGPLDAAALISACHEAYTSGGDKQWLNEMERAFNWFLGYNDLGETLFDFTTGACFDSIHPAGINENQGGKATSSFLLALHLMHQAAHNRIEL